MTVEPNNKPRKRIPTAPAALHAPTSRTPRQSRGQARVAQILDAAAVIVAGDGVGALAMHALARAAGTSTGSLYHFFPDRDSVITALHARHVAAVESITQQLLAIPDASWRHDSPAEAVARMGAPYFAYLQGHPDYLPLMHSARWISDDEGFLYLLNRIVGARLPEVQHTLRERYAVMLHAIATGCMYLAYGRSPSMVDVLIEEIPHALAAYLSEIEGRHTKPSSTAQSQQT